MQELHNTAHNQRTQKVENVYGPMPKLLDVLWTIFFTERQRKIRYLMSVGKWNEELFDLAKQEASDGLYKIGRRVCSVTGNFYFLENRNEAKRYFK